MTIEEAIVYWETFLSEIDQMEVDDCWTNEDSETQRETTKMAISALRQQDVPDTDVGKNEQLTLDELRKIYDGEEGPVWLKFGISRRFWPAILDTYDGELVAVWSAAIDFCHEKDYGKTWLAYRQKPEEGLYDKR